MRPNQPRSRSTVLALAFLFLAALPAGASPETDHSGGIELGPEDPPGTMIAKSRSSGAEASAWGVDDVTLLYWIWVSAEVVEQVMSSESGEPAGTGLALVWENKVRRYVQFRSRQGACINRGAAASLSTYDSPTASEMAEEISSLGAVSAAMVGTVVAVDPGLHLSLVGCPSSRSGPSTRLAVRLDEVFGETEVAVGEEIYLLDDQPHLDLSEWRLIDSTVSAHRPFEVGDWLLVPDPRFDPSTRTISSDRLLRVAADGLIHHRDATEAESDPFYREDLRSLLAARVPGTAAVRDGGQLLGHGVDRE